MDELTEELSMASAEIIVEFELAVVPASGLAVHVGTITEAVTVV